MYRLTTIDEAPDAPFAKANIRQGWYTKISQEFRKFKELITIHPRHNALTSLFHGSIANAHLLMKHFTLDVAPAMADFYDSWRSSYIKPGENYYMWIFKPGPSDVLSYDIKLDDHFEMIIKPPTGVRQRQISRISITKAQWVFAVTSLLGIKPKYAPEIWQLYDSSMAADNINLEVILENMARVGNTPFNYVGNLSPGQAYTNNTWLFYAIYAPCVLLAVHHVLKQGLSFEEFLYDAPYSIYSPNMSDENTGRLLSAYADSWNINPWACPDAGLAPKKELNILPIYGRGEGYRIHGGDLSAQAFAGEADIGLIQLNPSLHDQEFKMIEVLNNEDINDTTMVNLNRWTGRITGHSGDQTDRLISVETVYPQFVSVIPPDSAFQKPERRHWPVELDVFIPSRAILTEPQLTGAIVCNQASVFGPNLYPFNTDDMYESGGLKNLTKKYALNATP
jgi:hypothetical protein